MSAELWDAGLNHSGLAAQHYAQGHGVNGSTSVSKTESLGSNPSAPAKCRRWLVPTVETVTDDAKSRRIEEGRDAC